MSAVVAVIQMVSGKDVDDNLKHAERLITEAAEKNAQLVVLPETFSCFHTAKQRELAEELGKGNVQNFLSQQAKKYGLWLVGGTIPIVSTQANKVYAASLLYDDLGQQRACYNKIHLFDADVDDVQGSYRESDTFAPGSDVVVVETPLGRLGMAVCYDIRFPEFFRKLFERQVDIISVPAAFTKKTGDAHWLALLRARAIENQCYILGANQGGRHGRRETSGGSVIINAWGEVKASAGLGEACVVADYEHSEIVKIRQAMPVAKHRRF